MAQSTADRLRLAMRPRGTRLILLATLGSAFGATALLASGYPLSAIFVAAVAVLLLVALNSVTQRRVLAVVSRAERTEAERQLQIEKLVTRSEWRHGQSSQQILGMLRNVSTVKDVDRLRADASYLARVVETPDDRVGERDMEALLVHLIAAAGAPGAPNEKY
ncbi:hypothetical protein [Brevibacterium yomogidense]|uniref:hypothetical protein n=1 Tax=Brevibacterium yomogidense TaxID=946573 RepID=UPI001177CFB9|nr:hypothetical protein [Brevibacterium yomogidense]